jgi:hypothetical protein
LEQAWLRDSLIFGENFPDGQILSAILLESRSKLSHLGRRVTSKMATRAQRATDEDPSTTQMPLGPT